MFDNRVEARVFCEWKDIEGRISLIRLDLVVMVNDEEGLRGIGLRCGAVFE